MDGFIECAPAPKPLRATALQRFIWTLLANNLRETMGKCASCGWEGKREEMQSKEGGLLFYDHFYKTTYNIDITRVNYFCPRCGAMIESRRVIPGLPEDATPQ